jgi:hypothetical protein
MEELQAQTGIGLELDMGKDGLGQIAMFFECFKGLIDLLYVQMSTH